MSTFENLLREAQEANLVAPTADAWAGQTGSIEPNGESRTVFGYHTNFAYGIGYKGTKNAPYFLRKLWVDGALIFDATTGYRAPNWQWTYYDGTQDTGDSVFLEDPQIAEKFRDIRYPEMMYIILRNVNLSNYGLRAPDVTCEMWAANGVPVTEVGYAAGPVAFPIIGINWDTRRIYASSSGGGLLITYDLDTRMFLGFQPGLLGGSPMFFNYIPWLNAVFKTGTTNSSEFIFQNVDTLEVIGRIGSNTSSLSSSGGVESDEDPRIPSPNRFAYTFDASTRTTYIITRGIVMRRGLNVIQINGNRVRRPYYNDNFGLGEIAYICADHNRALFYMLMENGDVYTFNPRTNSTRLLWVNPDPTFKGNGVHHDPHLDVVLVFHRATLPTREHVRGLRGGTGAELWARVAQATLPTDANSFQQYNLSNTRAGTFGFGASSNGVVLDIATGQQRKFGQNFFGSRWDSERFLFVGMNNGVPVDRIISPFDPDNRVPLGTFLQDIGERMGYARANVIVTGITDTVIGAILIDDTRARELLSDICNFYKLNMVESGKTLRFTRRETGENINILASVDLRKMARLNDGPNGPIMATNRLDENDIPSSLTIWYIDRDADFSPVPYTAKRTSATVDREARLNLPLVLEKSTVVSLATGMLYDAWAVQVTHGFRLPPRYGYLEPGDVIDVIDGSFIDTVRLVQTTVNGDWSISVRVNSVRENGDFDIDTDETRMRSLDEGLKNGNPRSLPIIIDSPLWDFSLDAPGFSVNRVAAVPDRQNADWPGAALLYASQSVERGLVANFRRNPAWGRVLGVLGGHAPCATDYTNVLRVAMPEPPFEDITEESGLKLDTLIAVGRETRWELMTFGAFSWANGVGTFSKLTRGRLGTDHLTDGHRTGEYMIFCWDVTASHSIKNEDIGTVAAYTAIGVGEDLGGGMSQSFMITGNSARPYEPGDIRATRSGSDLQLAWARRDRLGMSLEGWRNSGSEVIPLSEEAERYGLEIYNTTTGALVRAVADLSSPSYNYTAAQQTADGYTAGDRIRMRVWQVSAQVGMGFSRERLVNVNF
jgi:hypothetical protein